MPGLVLAIAFANKVEDIFFEIFVAHVVIYWIPFRPFTMFKFFPMQK